jgi:hypothetical protein
MTVVLIGLGHRVRVRASADRTTRTTHERRVVFALLLACDGEAGPFDVPLWTGFRAKQAL